MDFEEEIYAMVGVDGDNFVFVLDFLKLKDGRKEVNLDLLKTDG